MNPLQEYLYVEFLDNRMIAEVHCKDAYKGMEEEITLPDLHALLKEYNIVHGIIEEKLQLITKNIALEDFPIKVAQGTMPIHGNDGEIHYEYKFTTKVAPEKENWNFRDVMKIPTVTTGEKIATLKEPTKGKNGVNVLGKPIPAKPGKPIKVRAGKNVVFKEDNLSYYAATDGQLSITESSIQVNTVYEVRNTLSMKDGNIDFIGSVVIHGDVPSGFKVIAGGDVKIFGLVEAAEVISGGSIYISEGIAGQKKGIVQADHDVHIGYINQGNVQAGNNLFVENSIMHSICTASKQVFCQRGNIIGGSISAGETIDAKEIGNTLNTKTEVFLGVNQIMNEKMEVLLKEKQELEENIEKLTIIGDKIKNTKNYEQQPKLRITLLKQRNSINKTKERLSEVSNELELLSPDIGDEHEAKLIVRKQIHPNAIVGFGKYKRIMKVRHQYVQIILEYNEIVVKNM